jgi:hypothetical protein
MPMSGMPAVPMLEIYECVLEVLDPTDGHLVASHDLPGDFFGFTGPDKLYQFEEDSAGMLTIHIWRATLATGRVH